MEANVKVIERLNFVPSSHLGIFKKIIFGNVDLDSNITQVAFTEITSGNIIESHVHESMEEIFLILAGQCEFIVDGEYFLLDREAVIKIPSGKFHSIRALTDCRLFYFGISV